MASFKNVSGVDREVSVDGRLVFVAAGDPFDVADEFAPSLRDQPHFSEITAKKPKPDVSSTTEGNN
jgi:hypothetical protein